MKRQDSTKNQSSNSTNYPMDKHSEFCKRCLKHNGFCINTKSARKDPECKI